MSRLRTISLTWRARRTYLKERPIVAFVREKHTLNHLHDVVFVDEYRFAMREHHRCTGKRDKHPYDSDAPAKKLTFQYFHVN